MLLWRSAPKCGLLILLLTTGSISADEQQPAFGRFLQLCLPSGPHFNDLIAVSKSESWTPLAADLAMAFTPIREPSDIQGWVLEGREDRPFGALVAFKGQAGGKPIEGCTAAVSGVDANLVEKQIVDQVRAKPVGEEAGQDTMYKRFSARVANRDNAITISLPRYPRGSDQIVVTIVAQDEVQN